MRFALRLLFIGLGSLPVQFVWGQYFQYSQYNFTGQRINPGMTANSRYASASADFRSQKTGGDFPINSSYLELSYPLLNSSTGQPWSGMGVSFLNDQSGGIYKTQEAAVSYALHIRMARDQSLSLGFRLLHQEMTINLDGFYTGSQYVPDRGFNTAAGNGENVGTYRKTNNTFSTGLYWQETDRKGRLKHHLGISIYDLNRPPDSFFTNSTTLSSTWVLAAGAEMYSAGGVHVIPEALFSSSSSNSMLTTGFRFQREINPQPRKESDRVDLITKYAMGRSGIVGIQLHKENLSVGLSYDFPLFRTNAGNLGALELGLTIRTLVQTPAQKNIAKRKKKSSQSQKARTTKKVAPAQVKKIPQRTTDSLAVKVQEIPLADTIAHPQLIQAGAKAGALRQDPQVIETVTLHFAFEFNSTDLDDSAEEFLQQLATNLLDHAEVQVTIVGYTDNIGSEKFNQKLSQKRADEIRKYLLQQGIASDRLISVGKGMQNPLNNNQSEADRAQNRRVELTLHY
jgi:type IX secretion system PorP/SprF family membrane protein